MIKIVFFTLAKIVIIYDSTKFEDNRFSETALSVPAVDVGNGVVLILLGSTAMNDDFLDHTHIVMN